jgi:dienelactone hydrolase
MVKRLMSMLVSRMVSSLVFVLLVVLGLESPVRVSADTPARAETPARTDGTSQVRAESRRTDFDAAAFNRTHPTGVLWKTPTVQQLNTFARSPATRPSLDRALPLPFTTRDLPAPRRWVKADARWFAFKDDFDDIVPGLLLTPAGKAGPFPLVIATHGLFSHKSQVIGQIGLDLIEQGFAVVAIDLPFHGERPGFPPDILESRQPGDLVRHWVQAVTDLRQAIDVATATPLVDPDKPVLAVGYSLGSWMSTVLGAADDRIKAMALMVGGATELPPNLLTTPAARSCDPRVAIAAFSPRPLLFVSARNDRVVTAPMSERLYAAAREPKTRRWYNMGHLMSEPAYSETAQWLHDQLPQPAAK